jgi:Lon protease-like protein
MMRAWPRSRLPLFPLSTVLFPDGVLPLQIFEVRYLDMISHCLTEDEPFGVVLLTQGQEVRTPDGLERFAGTGTLAQVQTPPPRRPGLLQVVCRGGSRFHVLDSERQQRLVDGRRPNWWKTTTRCASRPT